MADSRLQTTLHPVHDLALLQSPCVAVTIMFVYQRATDTRNIVKAAYAVGLTRIVKYTSIWGVAVILSHVSLR